MRNTTKNNQKLDMEFVRSAQFIIEFLEFIEQPLPEKDIAEILEGKRYLDQLLQTQKEVYGI